MAPKDMDRHGLRPRDDTNFPSLRAQRGNPCLTVANSNQSNPPPSPVQPAVYILASQPRGTLYVGVTSDLIKRVWQHKNKLAEGFTHRYGVHMLVYFELHSTMYEAISREKQLKAGSRAKKVALIETLNADWHDLYPGLL